MIEVEPVRRQIIVAASQAHAFEVFTKGIDRWWPRSHHIGKSPLKEAILEQVEGGRWYSICEDGSQCDVGKVLTWDPPNRLVLAWQINGSWQYDRDFLTEVEVRFTSQGAKKTRVDLEHRNLERYGAMAEAIRKEIDANGGWTAIVGNFGTAAEEAT